MVNSTKPIHAVDLSVTCNETSCPLSSRAPLFPANSIWVPGKAEVKTIQIINAANTTRKVSFFVKPDEDSPIAQYINLDFKNLSGETLWSGTLREVYSQQQILITLLNSNERFNLIIEATLAETAPNSIQGVSTTFDFSFSSSVADHQGINQEDQNKEDESSGKKSLDTSSITNSSEEPSQLQVDPLLLDTIAGLSDSISLDQLTQVDSDIKLPDSISTQSGILGVSNQNSECRNNPFWLALLLLESLAVYLVQKIKSKRLYIFNLILVPLIIGFGLYLHVCQKNLLLLTLVPVILVLFTRPEKLVRSLFKVT